MTGRVWFDRARQPARDGDGYTMHPDLDDLFQDGADACDELFLDLDKLHAAGFVADYTLLCNDVPDDHPAYIEYFDKGGCAKDWHPAAADPKWQLVAIYDTEDGPAAMFVCQVVAGGPQ